MSRDVFDSELGYAISAENGDRQAYIISGTAIPDGVSGKQSEAPIGSLYLRSGTGELYQKVANGGAPSDWDLNGAAAPAALGNWRPERVDAHTGQVLVAGTTDPTTWVDNDDGTAAASFTVGNYVLDGNCDLWEITAIAAPNLTLAAAATSPVPDDMFAVKYNMPDPAGQENQAIVTYDGASCVKVADADFGVANAISLAAGYAAAGGDITSADTVQSAIAKLDGNNDAQDSLLGTLQGATDLGVFTGATISDNTTVRGALQELETAHEETDANVDDLITLSGVPENSVDLGTFTGDIITDANTVKGALQEVETELVDTRDNVDDLITLSGVPENSVDMGTFTGDLLADAQTTKALFQRIEDLLDQLKGVQVTGITAATAVDAVPHAEVKTCKWLVEVFSEATPGNRQAVEVWATTDGTSVDDTTYAKLKLGANIVGLTINVIISGADMVLQVASTGSVTVTARRIEVVKSTL